MPELQEEYSALGLDRLDHWLPGIDLLLSVDPGCVGIPGHRVTGWSFSHVAGSEVTRRGARGHKIAICSCFETVYTKMPGDQKTGCDVVIR